MICWSLWTLLQNEEFNDILDYTLMFLVGDLVRAVGRGVEVIEYLMRFGIPMSNFAFNF